MRSLFSFLLALLSLVATVVVSWGDLPPLPQTAVPTVITLSPGPRFASNPIGGYTVHVEGPLGPTQGVQIEVEISPEADALVAWCDGQTHPIQVRFTDVNGNATFQFLGGGCVVPEDVPGAAYVAEVRFDGIAQAVHPYITSPDVVMSNGQRPAAPGGACENGQSIVTLSDASYFTRPIKLGLIDRCSKFTPPFNSHVQLSDAVFLMPYVKSGSNCSCN